MKLFRGFLENGDPQKAWVSILKWFNFDDLGVPGLRKAPFKGTVLSIDIY